MVAPVMLRNKRRRLLLLLLLLLHNRMMNMVLRGAALLLHRQLLREVESSMEGQGCCRLLKREHAPAFGSGCR